jgi:hypothetical protein
MMIIYSIGTERRDHGRLPSTVFGTTNGPVPWDQLSVEWLTARVRRRWQHVLPTKCWLSRAWASTFLTADVTAYSSVG